jgi:shikimate kinase
MAHLWLIGMMGAGKSAVGQRVAASLDVPFVDVDTGIAARLGCSIGELWGARGEEAFRDLEEAAVAGIGAGEPVVVATGGGVVLRDANVATMRRSGTVVWLATDPAVLAARVGAGAGRPLLVGDTGERLGAILEERRERYAAAAHAIVDGGAGTVEDVAREVVVQWTGS